jgi:hypothetical protein
MVVITITYNELVDLTHDKVNEYTKTLFNEEGTVNVSFGEYRVFNWDTDTKTIYNITEDGIIGISLGDTCMPNFRMVRNKIIEYVNEKELKL